MTGMTVFNKEGTEINTPDLRGRFPMGVNPTNSFPPNSFTKTNIGQSGGEETHLLTVDELPSHTHSVKNIAAHIAGDPGHEGGGYQTSGQVTLWDAGGSKSHNNMPPTFVLNYIIKQPTNGGTSYTIDYPYQTPDTLFKT
jgi:microcystin-dependent protein